MAQIGQEWLKLSDYSIFYPENLARIKGSRNTFILITTIVSRSDRRPAIGQLWKCRAYIAILIAVRARFLGLTESRLGDHLTTLTLLYINTPFLPAGICMSSKFSFFFLSFLPLTHSNMTDVPIPYTPTGTPIYEKIEGNVITFLTANWKVPKGVEYKGIIVYVHGFGEYAVLYTEFFDKLSQQGYEIFFFDQRGSGDTSPGDLVGVTDEYHTFNDLDFIVKTVLDRREDKTEKVFVGGHSMGGGIVLNYAIKGKYRDHV